MLGMRRVGVAVVLSLVAVGASTAQGELVRFVGEASSEADAANISVTFLLRVDLGQPKRIITTGSAATFIDVDIDLENTTLFYNRYEFSADLEPRSLTFGSVKVTLNFDKITAIGNDIGPLRISERPDDVFEIEENEDGRYGAFLPLPLSGSYTVTSEGNSVSGTFDVSLPPEDRKTPKDRLWLDAFPGTMVIERSRKSYVAFSDSRLLFSGRVGTHGVDLIVGDVEFLRGKAIRVYALPDPATLTNTTPGNWNAPTTWEDATATPAEDSEVSVTQHAVTVATDGAAHSLLIDDAGTVLVGNGANLTVVNDLDINNGTMELAPTGTLNVDGNLTMTPQAEYIFQLERVANGMTAVAGNADLAGTLIVQATSGLEAVGDSLRPIMIAGAITDTFDVEPAVGEHLGYGVFHWGVWYNFGTGVVREEVFQAAAGDTDGDGQVDNADLQSILGADSFNNGLGFGWTQGDFDGDTDVDNGDLQLILASGYFGTGPYAAVIPEPSALILALSGLLALACCRRLRRR